MNTPVCDFLEKYNSLSAVRAHMPGHKGEWAFDITEISGADSLYKANGIIAESEKNAGSLFGCSTFYSAEGSSLCIRAMLYLITLYAKEKGVRPTVLAARNVHSSFLSAAALLDIEVVWLYPKENCGYLSCIIDEGQLRRGIEESKPAAVFLTSPDYLGNMQNIKALAAVCKDTGVLCAVDNAHGAYLAFLEPSQHPIALGADVCCDSAHKTLPVLTGGAYLHVNKNAPELLSEYAKDALSLFGSTSPSYLILASLDKANRYLEGEYKEHLDAFCKEMEKAKKSLLRHGYNIIGNEPLKISLDTASFGYNGDEVAEMLKNENIFAEFSTIDTLVLMLNEKSGSEDLKRIVDALLSIEKRAPLEKRLPDARPVKAMTLSCAARSLYETVDVEKAKGRTAAFGAALCPPAVCVVAGGEIIDDAAIEIMKYYKIESCNVIKE